MTDEAQAAPADNAVQPSQIIENTGTEATSQGRGARLPEGDQPKESAKLSTRDAIAKAFDEAETKAKAPEKAEAEVKTEPKPAEKVEDKAAKPRAEDGKFTRAEKIDDQPEKADKSAAEKPATGQEGQERRQSEGRQHPEPPARFLPEARTKWANVPNEVKAEFQRVSQEMEGEIAQHKQFRDELKPHEDYYKERNVTLKSALERYDTADRLLAQDFGKGLASLAQMYGHQPAQAIAAMLQAFGVTPQQYAQHVAQNPQAHQAPAPQRAQTQQSQENPQLAAIAKELGELKSQMVTASIKPMIDSFVASHPDYHSLEPQIAEILQSGVVDKLYGTGLSPDQKLAEAYRMAGGSAPSRSAPEADPVHSDAPMARPVDPDGQKSIKGAPTSGQTGEPKWVPKSNREALERAFASLR